MGHLTRVEKLRYTKIFQTKILKGRNRLREMGADERILLKWTLKINRIQE